MSIPARFVLLSVPPSLIGELGPLCDEIELAVDNAASDDDVAPLLAEWNRRVSRPHIRSDFHYHGSMSTEEFIRGALLPVPRLVEDLTYAELKAVLQAVSKVEILDEADYAYYLEWLEANLPDSNMSDLIYWPDEWFGHAALFRNKDGSFKQDVDLTDDQILRYAMLKSGRILPDAPEVDLPFPMPDNNKP